VNISQPKLRSEKFDDDDNNNNKSNDTGALRTFFGKCRTFVMGNTIEATSNKVFFSVSVMKIYRKQ